MQLRRLGSEGVEETERLARARPSPGLDARGRLVLQAGEAAASRLGQSLGLEALLCLLRVSPRPSAEHERPGVFRGPDRPLLGRLRVFLVHQLIQTVALPSGAVHAEVLRFLRAEHLRSRESAGKACGKCWAWTPRRVLDCSSRGFGRGGRRGILGEQRPHSQAAALAARCVGRDSSVRVWRGFERLVLRDGVHRLEDRFKADGEVVLRR